MKCEYCKCDRKCLNGVCIDCWKAKAEKADATLSATSDELLNTKRRLESCLSLLGYACGAPPSPTWQHVLEFARLMERKLEANRHKGNRDGWISDNVMSLVGRIQDETAELIAAINAGKTAEEIANEAADAANFCMMVADWFTARAGLKE